MIVYNFASNNSFLFSSNIIQDAHMMGTKVMTVTTQTATTKWVMNGMTTGERGAQQNVEAAVRKSNHVTNDNEVYFMLHGFN